MLEFSNEEVLSEQLRILIDVSSFCEENQIKYFLSSGTLLGAVRHKGYIPWDDDIDIMMPRSDYEKFIMSYNTSNYYVVNYRNDDKFVLPFSKVCKKGTIISDPIFYDDINFGLNIDVFPMDGFPNNGVLRSVVLRSILILRFFLRVKTIRNKNKYNNLILVALKVVLGVFSTNRLLNLIDKFASYFKFDDCQNVGMTVWGYGSKEICNRAWFEEYVYLEFEGHKFRSPIAFDKYLKALYNNYLQLPPAEKQVAPHTFKVFWLNNAS